MKSRLTYGGGDCCRRHLPNIVGCAQRRSACPTSYGHAHCPGGTGEKKPLHERVTQRYFAPDYSGARPGPIKDVLCLLGTAKLLPGSAQSSQRELLQLASLLASSLQALLLPSWRQAS